MDTKHYPLADLLADALAVALRDVLSENTKPNPKPEPSPEPEPLPAAAAIERKWLRDTEVAARYSVSRRTVWNRVKSGQLPQPVRFSTRCIRFSVDELNALDAQQLSNAS